MLSLHYETKAKKLKEPDGLERLTLLLPLVSICWGDIDSQWTYHSTTWYSFHLSIAAQHQAKKWGSMDKPSSNSLPIHYIFHPHQASPTRYCSWQDKCIPVLKKVAMPAASATTGMPSRSFSLSRVFLESYGTGRQSFHFIPRHMPPSPRPKAPCDRWQAKVRVPKSLSAGRTNTTTWSLLSIHTQKGGAVLTRNLRRRWH